MRPFDYYQPKTVAEAVRVLDKVKNSVDIIAGGTDIMIELNEGKSRPKAVVDISKLKLNYVKKDKSGIHIGALTTFRNLAEDKILQSNLPALVETAAYVGSPHIRALGTIGGNTVNASVAGDTPTTSMAHGAQVVLKSSKGTRKMSIEKFNEGPGKCQIKNNELMTEIIYPALTKDEAVGYFKIGRRKSLAIVVLAVSIYIKKGKSKGKDVVKDARVILGAVNLHPMHAPEIEQALIGKELTAKSLYETLEMYTDAVDAAIGNRPSVVFKREAVRGAAKRCYDQILDKFGLSKGRGKKK